MSINNDKLIMKLIMEIKFQKLNKLCKNNNNKKKNNNNKFDHNNFYYF